MCIICESFGWFLFIFVFFLLLPIFLNSWGCNEAIALSSFPTSSSCEDLIGLRAPRESVLVCVCVCVCYTGEGAIAYRHFLARRGSLGKQSSSSSALAVVMVMVRGTSALSGSLVYHDRCTRSLRMPPRNALWLSERGTVLMKFKNSTLVPPVKLNGERTAATLALTELMLNSTG